MSGTDLVVLAFAASLAILVAAWVGRPLWHGDEPLPPPDSRAVALLTRRQGAMAALRDLEADYAAGRVADADYLPLRTEITVRGAATLAALDALSSAASERTAATVATIEADVAALRSLTAAKACAGCGAPVPSTARFCPACGATIVDGAAGAKP